jgi:beta-1,4-mannosyltransferase
MRRCTVLVLGDLGRSPRMEYHALALANHGVAVDVVAYAGHAPRPALLAHPSIAVHAIEAPTRRFGATGAAGAYLGRAAVDAAELSARALAALLRAPAPDVILAQTPPAFPTLALARAAATLRGARLVVDWHNLTDAMLAERLPAGHVVTRLARHAETALGRLADGHLCVSRALADHLRERLGAEATVLYDRPGARFRPLPDDERRAARAALGIAPGALFAISSTSWTADEDFDLLLDALAAYDGAATAPLFMLVTGDGPRRRAFEDRARGYRHVVARTAWLEADELPRALAAADVGVCLHRSASGLDLPMKLADMAGAGLPVCVLDYGPVLRERFVPGRDGLAFTTARELADALRGLAEDPKALARARTAVAATVTTWEDGWGDEARALFL